MALATLLAAGGAHAEDSMRCGNRLVSTGDGKDKVRTLCGDPTSVSFGGTIGRRATRLHDHAPVRLLVLRPAWVELPVEVWTYNFGSSKLLRKLRFVGDELVEIRTDGYGY